MAKIRVMVIEDNRLLRESVTAMLNDAPDITAVSSNGNVDSLEKIRKHRPDVVLLDLSLESANSLRVVEAIKQESPGTEIVVMDLIPSQADVVAFVKVGVAGFILNDASPKDFVTTIRSVVSGVKGLPALLTGSLFSHIAGHAIQKKRTNAATDSTGLTQREQEVLTLIAQGRSNKEVARELNIAVYTTKCHVHNMLRKLTLNTRLQLANFAYTIGMV